MKLNTNKPHRSVLANYWPGLICLLLVGTFWAAAQSFQSQNLLRGTDLILYDNVSAATTYKVDDAWNTNRTYVNLLGTTITPKETNVVTVGEDGRIEPSWNLDNAIRPLPTGDPNNNLAISLKFKESADLATTVTFHFARSVDNGNNYDTRTDKDWTVELADGDVATTSTVLTTNLPTAFTQGASHIRLYQIVIGNNTNTGKTFTLEAATMGGSMQ